MTILLGTSLMLLLLIIIPALIGKRITKKFNAGQKNWWLTIHIIFVAVYFSGLFGTLLLTAAAAASITGGEQIRAAHLFSKYFDWFMVIPGALVSLITGVWIAVRTNWGLTKYYWVLIKIFVNIGAVLFGSTLMRTWYDQTVALSSAGRLNPLENPAYLQSRQMLLIGTVISLSTLVFLVGISVFKPWGKKARER